MVQVFLDESGDGSSDGTEHIVLCSIMVRDEDKLKSIITKARQKLQNSKEGKKYLEDTNGEIKHSNFPDRKLLEKLVMDLIDVDMSLYVLTCYKNNKKFGQYYKREIINELFSYMFSKGVDSNPLYVITDKSFFEDDKKRYFQLKKFNTMLTDFGRIPTSHKIFEIDEEHFAKIKNLPQSLTHALIVTESKDSKLTYGLQAVDILAGWIRYAHLGSRPLLPKEPKCNISFKSIGL